jgi:hypothetical protein
VLGHVHPMKVAVCIPSIGLIRSKCAQALNELVAHTLSKRVNYNGAITQPTFRFFYEEAGTLEYKRTRLALRALEWAADYHLLIDWDHTFPPDALLRLARHNLPLVGTNYPMRQIEDWEPSALRMHERARGRGLEGVAAIGLGFCLIKSHVFNAVEKPWFRTEVGDLGELKCGEDFHFCNQVRRAGIPVYVDHDIIVGHIAERVVTIEREDDNVDSVRPASGDI